MPEFLSDKVYLDYSDVLLVPEDSRINSRSSAIIATTITTKYSKKRIVSIPVIVANMTSTGTVGMAREGYMHNIMVALHKFTEHHTFGMLPKLSQNFMSFGPRTKVEEIEFFHKKYPHVYLLLDSANGYTCAFRDFCVEVRDACPDAVIAAGNIATPFEVKLLSNCKVDIIKVGIGPGGHCRTREVTGFGVPQFSAVWECARVARQEGVHIIADGGITCIGDIAKAIGAGADFVMVGSLFAGFNESGGDLIEIDGEYFKEAYGMASKKALDKYGLDADHRPSEGRSTLIPLKGDVKPFMQEVLGGLRSAVSFSGYESLDEFKGNGTFIRVNNTMNRQFEEYTVGI